MQCSPKVTQHRAQAYRIDDTAGKIAEFVADARELAQDAGRCWACGGQATSKILVMFDDVVDLPDGALALDLGLKARADSPP